ncbi:acyloxyacyl hydrolase [Flavobacterium sp.]|uniref:acyloxyacyl hydrolase n=1 Tax=Flavobacterium sp. TaxID=239 RepID=UPI00286C91EA|nr:acyloxyacyl hydrolase [Flavobacterium sp.]
MKKRIFFVLLLLMSSNVFFGQDTISKYTIGFHHGFGSEFKNRNYSFTNNYYKLSINYKLKKTKNFIYEVVLQPEINFATHQLLNFYFITPDDPNYIEKRNKFTKLKDINQYILNVGFAIRKPITRTFSIAILASVGPMISNKETERLSNGFAFSDVLTLELSYKINNFILDIRPNVRHVSNAGLKSSNSGFNTKNIEFGISYNL